MPSAALILAGVDESAAEPQSVNSSLGVQPVRRGHAGVPSTPSRKCKRRGSFAARGQQAQPYYWPTGLFCSFRLSAA